MKVENFRHSGWENSTQHTWEILREEPTVIITFFTLAAQKHKLVKSQQLWPYIEVVYCWKPCIVRNGNHGPLSSPFIAKRSSAILTMKC